MERINLHEQQPRNHTNPCIRQRQPRTALKHKSMKLKTHLKAQYARIPRWARRSMGALLGLTLAFFTLLAVAIYVNHKDDGLRREVSLMGYNYTDRPIHSFSVNGAWGANAFAGSREGGGKPTCCTTVTIGETVKINYQLSTTRTQYEAGLRLEDFTTTAVVPPPQTPTSDFLTAHFYQDGRVELILMEFPGKAYWPAGTDMSKLE